jgi:hypothetical protein
VAKIPVWGWLLGIGVAVGTALFIMKKKKAPALPMRTVTYAPAPESKTKALAPARAAAVDAAKQLIQKAVPSASKLWEGLDANPPDEVEDPRPVDVGMGEEGERETGERIDDAFSGDDE